MNHTRRNTVSAMARPRRAGLFLVLLPCLLLAAGCPNLPVRPQPMADADAEKYDIRTIGDITTVAHAEPLVIGGVGLVVGLGRGGDVPPGVLRN